ncbi:MAG: cation transporter [Candidatus Schekmanbacteria bacterium]|nr:cation transporter [Candidatus Schekmanbacteria bacterium]
MAVSLGVAVIMLAGKSGAALLTSSSAIFSDAAESVIHIFATGIAALSLWYSRFPPDRQHPYGHGKIVFFSAGFEGALIICAAFAIVYVATGALLRGPELRQLDVGLAITAGLAAVNLALGAFLVRAGNRQNSLVLVANGRHVLTDMWTSLAVVIGVSIVWLTGVVWLDPVAGIVAAAHILFSGSRLLRQAYDGLMERASTEDTRRILTALDRAVADGIISGFHQLHFRSVDQRIWIEIHLLMPGDLPLTEAHRRASLVESLLDSLFARRRTWVTTHLEPVHHETVHPEGHPSLTDPLVSSDSGHDGPARSAASAPAA